MTDSTIDVVYATDKKYLRLTAASIHSLSATQPEGLVRQVYVLCGKNDLLEIKKSMRKKLGVWTARKVRWVGVDDDLVQELPIAKEGWLSPATYLRLYAAEVLPETHNLLYLDGDVLLRKSLDVFLRVFVEMHEQGFFIGARAHPDKGDWRVIRESFGLASYFNAGVLAINADLWRRHKIATQIVAQADRSAKVLRFSDQDLLNLFFEERRVDLAPPFNFFPSVESHKDPAVVTLLGPLSLL